MACVVFSSGGLKNFVMLPAAVVDRHLKDCSLAALKTLLYLLRNEDRSLDTGTIAVDLDLTEQSVHEAVEYWIKRGVLSKRADTLTLYTPAESSGSIPRFSGETVLLRAKEDKDLSMLLANAEKLLAKALTAADISTLFGMYDWLGLPAPVIALLLEYCVNYGSSSMSYIEKCAINWADEGITTVPLASDKLAALERSKTVQAKIASTLGIGGRSLTKKEKEFIEQWTNGYGYGIDEIVYAFEQSADNTGKLSFAYMNKVLSTSFEKGYKTAAQMQASPKPQMQTSSKPEKPSARKLKNNSVSSIDESKLFRPFWEIEE